MDMEESDDIDTMDILLPPFILMTPLEGRLFGLLSPLPGRGGRNGVSCSFNSIMGLLDVLLPSLFVEMTLLVLLLGVFAKAGELVLKAADMTREGEADCVWRGGVEAMTVVGRMESGDA